MTWTIAKPESLQALQGRRLAKPFGAHLERVRRSRGVHIYRLAKRMDIHHSRLRRYELGYACPPYHMLIQWAIALGVQPGELLPVVESD